MRTFMVPMIGLVLVITTTGCVEQASPIGMGELRYQDAVWPVVFECV